MSDDHSRELRELLDDAVADVEPRDRLGEIRRRTARPLTMRERRRWPLVVLGAGTATAAVVSAVAVLSGLGLGTSSDSGPPATRPTPEQVAVATYFVGDGARLFREFQSVPATDGTDALVLAALHRLETDSGPLDPDYSTVWPDGSFLGVVLTDEAITVEVGAVTRDLPSSGGPRRSDPDVALSIQQVVYTAQAAAGGLLPVRFESGGRVPDSVLASTVGDTVARDTTAAAAVSISDPSEDHEVDDLLTVRGVVGPDAGAPESVDWQLRDADGSAVVAGSAPVEGTAWEQTVDIADVPSDTYELVASVAGLEGGPYTDTRTVVVR